MAKRSFFDRLTGATDFDDFDDEFAEDAAVMPPPRSATQTSAAPTSQPQEEGDAQLTVDVYQTDNEIVIRTLVAGVRPEDLDVAITRDMVTISGKRIDQKEVNEDDYYYRELFWGSFSRTVLLPQEIDVDNADATEKHGLLMIRLPKINKDRQTKLKVKGN